MKTYLLKVEDAKAPVLADFLQKMDFVKVFRPVLHWQDEDFDDNVLEKELKASMLSRKNFAIAKHLADED